MWVFLLHVFPRTLFFLFKKKKKKGTVLLNSPLKECSKNSMSYCTKHHKSHVCSNHRSYLKTGVQCPTAVSLVGWGREKGSNIHHPGRLQERNCLARAIHLICYSTDSSNLSTVEFHSSENGC